MFRLRSAIKKDTCPANLTRSSTNMIVDIHDLLVMSRRALILFIPYAVFACPNFPSIGFLSPGESTMLGLIDGLPKGFALSSIPSFFNQARFSLVQYILSANTSSG